MLKGLIVIPRPAITMLTGNCLTVLETLPAQSVHCCVTSPPYFNLRDYGVMEQIGIEQTPRLYTDALVEVFRKVRRVLSDDGTLWLNLGDSFSKPGDGCRAKNLLGVPWRVALALQDDGWYLRSDIIWQKPAPMPESVSDRPTRAHEYIFLLTKSERYFYDAEAIKEPSVMKPQNRNTKREDHPKGDSGRALHRRPEGGAHYEMRNRRSVWTINTETYKGAHFATMPSELAEICILAGTCETGHCAKCGKRQRRLPDSTGWHSECACNVEMQPDVVLDPFGGTGTTGIIANRLGRKSILIELNPEYVSLAENRIEEG